MLTILGIVISAALALLVAWFQSDINRLRERFSANRVGKRRAREAWEAYQKERFAHDPVFRSIVMLENMYDTTRSSGLMMVALASYAFAGFLGIVHTLDVLEPVAHESGGDYAVTGFIVVSIIMGGICVFFAVHAGGKVNKRLLLFGAAKDKQARQSAPK